jgi:hypothetical protein
MSAEALQRAGVYPGAPETELTEVETRDERIDDPHQGLWRHIIFDTGWKQADLAAVRSCNEAHEHLGKSALTWCRF